MKTHRVQEYVLDMGVYHKKSIYEITHVDYNKVNVYTCRQLVILPSDDFFGERLPNTIRSSSEMTEIKRAHEPKPWLSKV